MEIKNITLYNFRDYQKETTVAFNDLTVFVGKNDVGKSTILEALDIFFNENKGVIKMDNNDINVDNKDNGDNEIRISVTFEDFPEELTLDATNVTNLKDEYLLNSDGNLEILKKYPKAGKEKVFLKANHPSNSNCSNLFLKKNTELKRILTNDMNCQDKSKNAEIRKTIWEYYEDDLQLQETEIALDKADAKNTWNQLKKYMPLFSLFQSDRENSDNDDEVQDPMKYAVAQILNNQELQQQLDEIASQVEDKLKEVSKNTLVKLNEMNPEIAESLSPNIPSREKLKWKDVFKNVSITGDENIPINKRGSGVKRLVLLNFFRAEAERRQKEDNIPGIIYAIEEPETSQHPKHQRKLIDAFKELSQADNTQVILTTHSPAIVKLLEFESLRLVKKNQNDKVEHIQKGDLPYPSLNEVNFLAFSESNEEYHNELYGYLESESLLGNYKNGKDKFLYKRYWKGELQEKQKIFSEYIRHQIHHPENKENERYTFEELQDSINQMRTFLKESVE